MKNLKLAKQKDKTSGKGQVLLIHTTEPSIVRTIENSKIVQIGKESFIEGLLISPDPTHFDDNKKVLLNLRHIVSITEFDSIEQFMKRKKGNLKLLLPDRKG